MIRAIMVSTLTFLYIVVVGLPFLIHAWITKRTDYIYEVGMKGARLAVWLSGVKLELYGMEKIPHGRAAIYMPNHQSNCDPPAVVALLPPVLVMAKREFFKIPILGQAMILRGFIPVDRKNREKAIAAVEKAVESMKAGKSFLAFPEGTRSPDGRLQAFKKGLFVLAIKAQALIVPVSVSGARKIMPKGKFEIQPGVVRITFHDPISAAEYSLDQRKDLIEATRQAIAQGLNADEQPIEGTIEAGGGVPHAGE
jgi:1-acyl-sn-glycerol-3-phosphate acyltransferase